jgi:hypothetical protein
MRFHLPRRFWRYDRPASPADVYRINTGPGTESWRGEQLRKQTMKRTLFGLLCLLPSTLVVLAASAWGALAIVFASATAIPLRGAFAGTVVIVGLVTAVALWIPRWRRRMLVAFALTFLTVLGWWQTLKPSNDREWQPDVAVLPYADVEGERVTVHNIRNFDYRSETDYTPHYYDKTFELSKLDGVDLVAVYWMGPAIAHIFLSFGFEGGDHLAVSIETRKEVGEGYSTLKGFFRQYELFYVVADERDVIRLRTNYRKDPPESVYVYRISGPLENARRLFLAYIDRINRLKVRPEFYNTLTTNCTTAIWMNAQVNPNRVPFSWKVLASGYVPEYLYELGRLDQTEPFPVLQAKSLVNARAQAADQAPDFSRRIRETGPNPPP